ncbi:MAG: hypothetical protein PVS3B1_36430 [Ktedonobacteraceae bacterium]
MLIAQIPGSYLQRRQILAHQMGLIFPALLLAYLTNQPFPAFPIFASTSQQQPLENLQAGDIILSPETMHYLENGYPRIANLK